MSELREECYKCLNNQSCPSIADYGSIVCMTTRKFKMPRNNEEDSVYATKFAVMQQQINEKDKRIKELEEINTANRKVIVEQCDYIQNKSIPVQKVKDKIEELKNDLKLIACDKDCSKCFNKEGKALYRGSNFVFCYAYHQIKILEELLEEK